MHPGPGQAGTRPVIGAIHEALAAVPQAADARLCVAFSGGLDSSVMLHALAGMVPGERLRAVHVHHGLHADASDWERHCAQLCATLGVPYACCHVQVAAAGEGLEAAAREARYAALFAGLAHDELLLTAHHRDDQAETLLLNLMRGSGPAGLAGIAAAGSGQHPRLLRPLLALPRGELLGYALAAGLEWIEDPANADPRFDRNFLRHQLLPLLASRWPASGGALARSAGLCAEAAALLDELADADARRVVRAGRVVLEPFTRLTEPRQRNLLRRLARLRTASAPPERRLRAGLAQLLEAGPDRQPLLAWEGGEIRRFRGHLYVQKPLSAPVAGAASLAVRAGASLDSEGPGGRISLYRSRSGGLDPGRLGAVLTLRYRQGGECLRPAGGSGHRALKKLLQEAGIVPWMRAHIPLLYAGERLVAVADLWIAHEAAAAPGAAGLRLRWDRHPPCR
ncbi:MAG: tRNA lysidine(34) synthetase TilS [Gammaproteobacteria bacterium]|nr:tRNA lysidine(34) synthetase TilS [Gammaproteobacteria bacterium]